MDKKNKLYYCYSLNLRRYLFENGVKYEIAALNPNSKKLFWIYQMSDKLSELLIRWTNKENLKEEQDKD